MTNYDKYYIYQGYGKPRVIKDRLLTKLGPNFRGLVSINVIKAVYGRNVDHYTKTHNYILDNAKWTKINIDTQMRLVNEHDLEYEHIDSDWVNEGVLG